MRDAVLLRLTAPTGGVAELEAKAKIDAAAQALGDPSLSAAMVAFPAQPGSLQTALAVRGLELRWTAHDAAVTHRIADLALEPAVPLIDRDDVAMADPDDDVWMLRQHEPAVSLRAIERRLVTLLIAAARAPDRCPTAVRLAPAVALGQRIDAALADAVQRAGGVEAKQVDALCRRERQRRLAHEQLLERGGQGMRFASGLFLQPSERVMPVGIGGKAAMLLQGMQTADDAWEPSKLGELVSVLLGQMIYEDAIIAHTYRAGKAQPSLSLEAIAHRLAPNDTPAVAFEACALSAALAQSLDPARFITEIVSSYTTERWPAEPRRSGGLALLYALTEETVPKEAAASPEQLAKLLAAAKPRPLCTGVPGQAPIPRVIDKLLLERLSSRLDRSTYIR